MDKRKLNKEKRRLYDLLERAEVPKQKQAVLEAIIDNLAWQRLKLDEARDEMQDASITCHYCNGGGQEGERENPIFKAYINLWRGYLAGIEKIQAYLPKDLQEEAAADGINILETLQKMKKATA